METIGLAVVIGTLCIACFLIGVKAGRHEEIKVPDASKLNPVTIYHEHKERKTEKEEEQAEIEKNEAILRNVDRYDGTDRGQEDIK